MSTEEVNISLQNSVNPDRTVEFQDNAAADQLLKNALAEVEREIKKELTNPGSTEVEIFDPLPEGLKSQKTEETFDSFDDGYEEPDQEETEEYEEVEIVEEEQPKKRKIGKEDSKSVMKRRLYHAIQEKRNLEEAVYEAQLQAQIYKEQAERALNAGTMQYEENVLAKLEQAKRNYQYALEEGDSAKAVDAQHVLTNAVLAAKKLEDWALEDQYARSQKQPEYQEPPRPITPAASYRQNIGESTAQAMAQEWLVDHPYLNQASKYFDKKTAERVINYANDLDNKGYDSSTPDYYSKLDNYIDRIRNINPSNNMGSSTSHIGGVSSSRASLGKGGKVDITLSEFDKRCAREAGMSEDAFKKIKITELQKPR